ncbi:hypothetical protein MBLNU13_g09862t1 [Cladosporium sp. NU13]
MSTRSAKRSAPADFDEEPEHRNKMPRAGDFVPALTSHVSTWPPAPAQSPSDLPENDDHRHGPATRLAKRKFAQQQSAASNPLPSKRARASDGRWLLPTCRGGSTRRRQVVADSDDKDDDESSSKNAAEQSPATPTREPAAETSESNDEGESTSSSQKPIKNTDGSGSKDADSSEPMSSSRKTEDDTSSSNNDSSGPASSPCKTVDSSGPMSSPRKTVNGTENSSDETTESAESSEKVANDSNSTSDATADATSSESATSANEQSSEEASRKAAKVKTRLTERPVRHISGLLNNSNQCFSNSVIQFIDAALDGHDVDTVLGPVESVAPFTQPPLQKSDSFSAPKTRGAKKGAKKPESKMSKARAFIHDRIEKVRKSDKLKELRTLSPRLHLRVLLHRMRQYKSKAQPEKVTGYLFQQILAYGDEDASRQHLDGRDQQDCYEYFDALLNGIKYNSGEDPTDEESAEKPAIIDSLFDFKSETASLCSNESCKHKGAVKEETNSAYTITAPEEKATLMDLLEESNVSPLDPVDMPCPKCGGPLQRVTEFTEMADNFVLHVNRVANHETGEKIKTAIELPFQPIELCGKEYVLNAIIRHRGNTVQAGHYSIFRKRSRDWNTEARGTSTWYYIDDEDVSTINARDIKDHGRNGQSAMLLFKTVESMEITVMQDEPKSIW